MSIVLKVVLTDSGEVQKEAYFFKIPCVTLRDEIKWVERLKSGWNALTGADKDRIINAILTMQISNFHSVVGAYRDGKTAEKIVRIISGNVKGII